MKLMRRAPLANERQQPQRVQKPIAFLQAEPRRSLAQYHCYRAASTPSARCPLSSFFTSAGSGGSSGAMEALFAGPNPARGIRLEGYLAVKVPVDGIEKTSS